jgi:ribosomal protein S18 acetylase RimI-like enzyme
MKSHYIIKRARADNVEVLNDIMKRSIAIWNYSAKEVEQATKKLAITTESINKSICYIAELNGLIKGFFCIEPSQNEETSDAKFYIEPDSIREGLGTILWKEVVFELKNKGIKHFKILVDRNAQGFYEKLGAVKVDEQPSEIIEGYMIPIMKYNISKNEIVIDAT